MLKVRSTLLIDQGYQETPDMVFIKSHKSETKKGGWVYNSMVMAVRVLNMEL